MVLFLYPHTYLPDGNVCLPSLSSLVLGSFLVRANGKLRVCTTTTTCVFGAQKKGGLGEICIWFLKQIRVITGIFEKKKKKIVIFLWKIFRRSDGQCSYRSHLRNIIDPSTIVDKDKRSWFPVRKTILSLIHLFFLVSGHVLWNEPNYLVLPWDGAWRKR